MGPGSRGERCCCGVAVRTVCSSKRRTRRRMHRIIGGAVIGGMAAVHTVTSAPRRKVVGVVAVDVALRALHGGSVQTGERESGVVVIKSRVGPADLVMAGIASLREARRDVIRNASTQVGGVVVIGLMAGPANRVPQGQIVVVADVALVAIGGRASGSHLVVALQSPTRRSVAPGSCGEGCGGGVTVRTVCGSKRRTRRRMHRIIGGAVIGGVAAVVGVRTT